MKTLITCLLGMSLLGGSGLLGQSLDRSVVNATGASLEAGGLQLDQSVGEAVIAPLEASSFLLTQGFLQGTRNTTGLPGLPHGTTFAAYPNPVGESLKVTMEGPNLDFWLVLYDASGRTISNTPRRVRSTGKWQGNFEFSRQAAGMYYLLLTDAQGKRLSYRSIQKR